MKNYISNPRIAIVIAVYNGEEYIKSCLDSLKKQEYSNWVAYIVNDGSTDHTEEICKAYECDDSRFKLLNKKNGGVVESRKYAIDRVSGCEYLTFLDADDLYIKNDLFSKIVSTINDEDADCICYNYKIGDFRNFSKFNTMYSFSGEYDLIKNIYNRTIIDGNSQFAFYPTEIVKNYFKILKCANDDFVNKIEMMKHCKKCLYIPEVGYYYRINQASLTHKNISESDVNYYYNVKKHTDEYINKYPKIKDDAEYFKNWVLLWLIMNISKCNKEKELSFFRTIWDEFKNNWKIYLLNKRFSIKDKITYILIRLHLFRIIFNIYHKIL